MLGFRLISFLLFPVMCNALGCVLVTVILCSATPAHADDDTPMTEEDDKLPVETYDDSSIIPHFLRGYKITVGPAVKQLDFTYTRPHEEDYVGTMTEGMYSPTLSG
jgi:hypothetical protein